MTSVVFVEAFFFRIFIFRAFVFRGQGSFFGSFPRDASGFFLFKLLFAESLNLSTVEDGSFIFGLLLGL